MKNLKENVEKKINKLETTKTDLQKKLIEDFEYGFKWHSEELYKTCYKLRQYNLILGALEIKKDDENEEQKIEGITDYLTKQILNWSVSRSTCQLTVQQSIYEFEATKEILDEIKWFF